MKIMILSDFHGVARFAEKMRDLAVSQKFDCIVVCGDLTDLGPVKVARQIIGTLSESKLPVLYVPGNMDPRNLVDELDSGFHVHGRGKIIGDVGFVGAGSYSNLKGLLEQGLKSLVKTPRFLVFVTHVPPKGTKVDLAWDGSHIGSLEVREAVEKYKPNLVVCGHVHEARGVDRIGESVVCNPGPAYNGFYAEVFLDEKVKVKLLSLKTV
ncbi:MAG: hypothetical protein DRO36_00725 [Candidatus Hecatellales archaeon]|nr:MAG: hypothetical protein DRO36_00725 [Candidatus Hecatellales archaeon]